MDVRMPDGTVIRNVPDGTTKDQLQAKLSSFREPSMSALPEGINVKELARQEVSQQAQQIEEETPLFRRMEMAKVPRETAQAALPAAAGTAAMAMGPAGMALPALAAQAGLGGGGAAVGELGRQQISGEKIDPMAALTEGAEFGAGAFGGGLVFKGIGSLAKKAFVRPLTPEAQQAAQFASEKNIPFLGEGRAKLGKATLGGEAILRNRAEQVNTAINRTLSEFTKDIRSIDAADEAVDLAVQTGRKVFDEALAPGMSGIKAPLERVKTALGDNAQINIDSTAKALGEASDWLKRQGITSGSIAQKINSIRKTLTEGDVRALDDLDELYGDFWRLWNTKSNRSARKAVEKVTSAIVDDINHAGNMAGYKTPVGGFAEDFAQALAKREEFRNLLKENPEFKTLSKIPQEKTRVWLNTLFNSGKKPLAELEKASPEAYNELSNAWLAKQLWNTTTVPPSGFGRVVDGNKLKDWVTANKQVIRDVFGKEKYQAINQFSEYAASSAKGVQTALKGGPSPTEMMARGAAEIGAMITQPAAAIPSEAASLWLAHGMTNPNSWLFKALTQGIKGKGLNLSLKAGGGVALSEQ